MLTGHRMHVLLAVGLMAGVALLLLLGGLYLYVTRSKPMPERAFNYQAGRYIVEGLNLPCQMYYREVGAVPPSAAEVIRHQRVSFADSYLTGVYVPEDAIFELRQSEQHTKRKLIGRIRLAPRDPSYPVIEYDIESSLFIDPATGDWVEIPQLNE